MRLEAIRELSFLPYSKVNMKIIFYFTDGNGSGPEENEKERFAKVHLQLNEKDLVERRQYDLRTFCRRIKSRNPTFWMKLALG